MKSKYPGQLNDDIYWTAEDSFSFYVIVMNRAQTKRSILLIGREAFTCSSCELRDLPVRLVYEEECLDVWINNNQLTHFLSSSSNGVFKFIYGSEKSNQCHLYMRSLKEGVEIEEEHSITTGEWTVIKEATPIVDETRQQIYYLANSESPVLISLCVSSFKSPFCQQHQVLTPTELCYKFDRAESDLHVKPDLGFVCWLSSVTQLPECHFYSLRHLPDKLLPTAHLQYRIRLQPAVTTSLSGRSIAERKLLEDQAVSDDIDVPMSPASNQPELNEPPPLIPEELFFHSFCEVPLEDEKTVLQCLVLLPVHDPDYKGNFPVIHYVYGGPGSQLVRNNWVSVSQFLKFVTAGYAIFLVDSRGSSNRGIHFESVIKHNLGSVEVDDQVFALKYVSEHYFPMLDLDRVGVAGWSYGGYMALQLIAQHPQLYKCSVPAGVY